MQSAGSAVLRGVTVLDVSRMLPGAVLARMLLDLGARVIKLEQPRSGDPMRSLPPLIEGIGAGFCAFHRGAESVELDLARPEGAATLRKLARHADVLLESFRPGTLAAWGAGPERLAAINPALIICSLSGFGLDGPARDRVGHDLNFVAASGLLSLLGGDGVPRVQLADVAAALLACPAVLAALLERQRTGRGAHLDQPLVSGPLPFLTLPLAEASAGGDSTAAGILSGACPAYRLYRCADGLELALGALEPKFWAAFVEAIGLDGIVEAGLDTGDEGRRAAGLVQQTLATRPRDHWLSLAAARNLPLTAVHDLAAAARLEDRWSEDTPAPGGGTFRTPGPYLRSAGATPQRPAPRLGQHTAAVFAEFGIEAT